MKLLRKLERWFDLNLGWIFINGMKTERWQQSLKDRYGSTNEN